MPAGTSDVTVVLLAGGEATRLPGKLERRDAGDPLIVRAYERYCDAFPVVVSAKSTFEPAIDERLRCPVVVDRWTRRGPLAGILSAFAAVRTPLVCVVAADLPDAGIDVVRKLIAARTDGDEAVVPEHGGTREPLCALYHRAAFDRVALPVLRDGSAAVRDVLAGLRVRTVAMPAGLFTNINTRADWARAFAS